MGNRIKAISTDRTQPMFKRGKWAVYICSQYLYELNFKFLLIGYNNNNVCFQKSFFIEFLIHLLLENNRYDYR